VTGLPDQATQAALAAELEREELTSVAALQGVLTAGGFYTGPIDGVWSDAVSQAVMDAQVAAGQEPTGEIDAATLQALAEALRNRPPETTTTSSTTSTSTTVPSTTTTPTTSP
jgi:hypothetical protein